MKVTAIYSLRWVPEMIRFAELFGDVENRPIRRMRIVRNTALWPAISDAFGKTTEFWSWKACAECMPIRDCYQRADPNVIAMILQDQPDVVIAFGSPIFDVCRSLLGSAAFPVLLAAPDLSAESSLQCRLEMAGLANRVFAVSRHIQGDHNGNGGNRYQESGACNRALEPAGCGR